MTQLHPVVEEITTSGKYVPRRRVEAFCEHELRGKDGEVTRTVDKAALEKIAHVCNAKTAQGALSPVGPGHTFDDVYDEKGQLVRKFPEHEQPEPIGYLLNYTVDLNPVTQKYCLYVDEWIQRFVKDPSSGKMVDGIQYSASFPRRSAEVYHNEGWLDWLAMLRRAPRLDLAIEAYSKANPDHTYYAFDRTNQAAPVVSMAKGKMRYSFDTGGDMDPTQPPSAAPPAQDATPPNAPPSGEGNPLELSPEHAEAADAYANRTHGMHASRIKPLMQHLHNKYAMECGLSGDMNTPYAMAMPGPAATPPTAAPAATPHPATPPNPAPRPESDRMQHDQAAIEKERYERRLADLEAGLASEKAARQIAEQEKLKIYYERQLMQLVYEGYEGVVVADEMVKVEKRRYGKEQFDDYISDLRRLPKAPVATGGRIDPWAHTLVPTPPAAAPTNGNMSEAEFAKAQRYSRQHPEMPWEEVKQKYNKPELNGVK